MEKCCVLFEARTASLSVIKTSPVLDQTEDPHDAMTTEK
jgi:hypothetical protein